MKQITIIVEDIPEKVKLPDEEIGEASLECFLRDDVLRRLIRGEFQAKNSEGLVVGRDYHPHEDDIITLNTKKVYIDYDVVANEYGETIKTSDYVLLRQKLKEKGYSLWKLHLDEARSLVE